MSQESWNELEDDGEALEAIAVVGMAGRFPGAASVDELWSNLRQGLEGIHHFDDDELRRAGVSESLLENPNYVRARGVLDGVEDFDAPFFGFTPREASLTDPQQRLFLEHAWQALEQAACDPERFKGRIAVFGGMRPSTYLTHNLRSLGRGASAYPPSLGNQPDFLATQVAYRLNLKGPAVDVQSACSTSLVAVHLACQSLLNRECDLALAGGVSVAVPQTEGYLYQEGSINSPDGHCRAFDAQARGTVIGHGVGLVALERLEDAQAAGRPIHAVLLGSAINNDGSLKVGYTAPSVEGQAEVLVEALEVAGVEASSVTYIETHGTGTELGDPVEVSALNQAFDLEPGRHIALGSLKSNLGHLDAAAGVAGLIKASLAVEHGEIPPSLHFETPNPQIPFDAGPFYVNTELTPWTSEGPRRAGVSSFGVGGTNAHAIVEEPPESEPSEPEDSWQCLVLSAATETAADQACDRLADWLKEHPDASLADVAHTLAAGRKVFPHRRTVACRDVADAAAVLAARSPGRLVSTHHEGNIPDLVFLFPGQGAQHPGMARDLYDEHADFRQEIDRGAERLKETLGLDLRELLFPAEGQEEEAAERLNETRFAQPALFLVEHALAGVWKSRGLEPQALVGHSVGELVAACLAGVFSWEDALDLVAERGRLMQSMTRGAMLSVPLPLDELESRLGDEVVFAAHNAPGQVVVSGPEDALDTLRDALAKDGVEARRLHTSHAFHSPSMDEAAQAFTDAVSRVERPAPSLPVYSNVSGAPLTEAEAVDPAYWGRQLRQPVRFREAIDALGSSPLFLEVGPGQTLGPLLRQWPEERQAISSLPHVKDKAPGTSVLAAALGRLWAAGVQIHWPGVHQGRKRRLLRLPTYAFDRQRHWVDPGPERDSGPQEMADWFYLPRWRQAAPAGLASSPSAADGTEDEAQTWLLFHDPMGLTAHLAQALEAEGRRVVTAVPGQSFEALAEHHFALDPTRREDLGQLFRDLADADLLPHRIVHGGALRPETGNDDEELQAGFYSLLALAQALGERGMGTRLDVLSRDLFRILGDEQVVPARAALLGPLRVLPQELPQVTTRLHELAPKSEDLPGLAAELLEELRYERPDDVLAYRGGARFVLGWQPQRLAAPKESPWPVDGSVLVTGGTEEPGLTFVEELAQRGVPGLLLLGDASPDADSEAGQRLAAFTQAETVLQTVDCDLADASAVAQALADFESTAPPVAAVVHAADHSTPGLMMLKDAEQAAASLAPKVAGTRALLSALGDRDLAGFVAFGATSAITGALGQADGCAANAVLDALAHEGTSFPRLTVDWPVWRLPTESTGNAAIDAWVRGVQEQYGLDPAEGFQALEHALAAVARVGPGALPQVLVSRHDFETLLRQQQGMDASSMLGQLGSNEAPTRDRSADDPNYVAPRSDTEGQIVLLWQEMFGFEPIGVEDEFFQLGGHSLLAVQMVSRLRDDLDVDLTLAEFLESPTVAAIAERAAGHEEEEAEFDDLLSEIENLSPEEIAARLADMGGLDDE